MNKLWKVSFLTVFIITIFSVYVYANSQVIIVWPGDMDGWTFHIAPGDIAEMVNGPGSPPSGLGSAHFVIGSGNWNVPNLSLTVPESGIKLKDITSLEYWTYVENDSYMPYIVLEIYSSNPSCCGYYISPSFDNQTIIPNTWQKWDVTDRLKGIEEFYPNATVVNRYYGGIRFAGSNAYVDAFTLGIKNTDTTYDFELQPLTNKDQCKNDNWKNYGFKNQGDCVSYVSK